MKQHYYQSINSAGLHRLAYTEWGSPNSSAIICVHGLNRNSRDFDPLAQTLHEQGHWVICPDLAGRGLSDWLSEPHQYCFEQYLQDLVTLIARLGVEKVDWIGTSLGGLLGIFLASMPQSPIKRLIINDIGPDVPQQGLDRLAQNALHKPAHFSSIEAAERYFRERNKMYGQLTDQDWRTMTKHSIKPNRQGGYQLHHDPRITPPAIDQEKQALLWLHWKKIACPTLVIQGEESDFLLANTVTQMKKTNRYASSVSFPGVGHAPPLRHADQIQPICEWLKKHS